MHELHAAGLTGEARVDVAGVVAAVAGARVHARRPRREPVGAARVLQGVVRRLEQQTLLRVDDGGLGGAVTEEARVEAVDALDDRRHPHQGGVVEVGGVAMPAARNSSSLTGRIDSR